MYCAVGVSENTWLSSTGLGLDVYEHYTSCVIGSGQGMAMNRASSGGNPVPSGAGNVPTDSAQLTVMSAIAKLAGGLERSMFEKTKCIK